MLSRKARRESVLAILMRDVPQLRTAKDPLEIARLSLPWVASACVWGIETSPFHDLSADEIYHDRWQAGTGATCGGMSLFFKKVLNGFGVDAFTLNFGDDGTRVTHMIVVVPSGDSFYGFDPFTGTYFVDAFGRFADILAMQVRSVQVEYRRDGVGPLVVGLLKEWKQKGLDGTQDATFPNGKCSGFQYTRAIMLATWPELQQQGFDTEQEITPQLLRRGVISHDGGNRGELLKQQIADLASCVL